MNPFLLQSTETRKEFDWGHLPDPWVIFLVIVPLVVIIVTAIYRRENPTRGGGVRWLLVVLRVAVILAVLTFLAQPILRKVTYQTRDPRLIVMVDDSLSMGITDKFRDRDIPRRIAEFLETSPEVVEQITRYGLVDRLLVGSHHMETAGDGGDGAPAVGQSGVKLLDRLREKMSVSLYSFAGSARKIDELPRLRGAAPGGGSTFSGLGDLSESQGDARVKQTRIGDSVLETLFDLEGGAMSLEDHGVLGIVVFTDGQSNSGVLQPEEMAYKLKQRGIPLLMVGVGNPDPPKNIRVADLDVDEVVLAGDEVSFNAAIVAEGFAGESVQVDLLFDGAFVDTKYVTLEGGEKKQTVTLKYEPTRPGDFTVTVQVEKLGGELFWDDNIFARPIKVLDEKIRVLYVEGPPRWEYRYLNHALTRDPTIEAHILLMSADREFRQESSPGLEPLVGFPDTSVKLFDYHVIIIGDVAPDLEDPTGRPFRENMELIQKFVSDQGGGVIFIAGANANPRAYLHTPLYPLLPVEVSESGASLSGRGLTDTFNVKLTGAGKEHVVMRLDSDRDRNLQLWESDDHIAENHLPGFYWFAEVTKPKLAAIPLAMHPRSSHAVHGPRVIFAIQNFSKGRVFYSGVDNTWRWRAGVGNLYLWRFWGQVVRFAASGRLHGDTLRYSIATDKRIYTIGERVSIDCKVYDANMEPSTEPTVIVRHAVQGRDFEAPDTLELRSNRAREAGTYEGSIIARHLGSHNLWLGTESERLAFQTFTVEVPPLEYRDPRLDRSRMKKVAALSGGKYYELYEFRDAVTNLAGAARPRTIPVEERQDDLWDEVWVLCLFTGLIAAEWVLRKMVRLL